MDGHEARCDERAGGSELTVAMGDERLALRVAVPGEHMALNAAGALLAGIELGAQSYDQTCTLDGKPSVALSVYQLPGSNALEVARRVKERMAQLQRNFPPGIEYAIVYDTTPFINESIIEVFETLFDAIVRVLPCEIHAGGSPQHGESRERQGVPTNRHRTTAKRNVPKLVRSPAAR